MSLNPYRKSKIKAALIARDGNSCAYCRRPFTAAMPPTIDHLVPVSRGGPTRLDNLVLACRGCNLSKGHTVPRRVVVGLDDALDRVKLQKRMARKA